MDSKLKIKFVNNNKEKSKKTANTYKINIKNNNNFEKKLIKKDVSIENVIESNNKLKVNDIVIHNEEKIQGKVNFIGSDKFSVIWEDGTRERFSNKDMHELTICKSEEIIKETTNKIIENVAEVEIETRSIPKTKQETEVTDKLDDLYSKAFQDMEDEYDDIIDANPNKFKEQQLKRQVDMMEKKMEDQKISKIKDDDILNLISLMKDKKIITDSEESNKINELKKMSYSEFESFKQSIISNTPVKEVEMTDAEKMLQRIKFGGPIVGDFSKSMDSYSSSEPRSLAGGGQPRSLGGNERTVVANNAESNKLNYDGFKDLQGLTKPLQVVSEQKSPRQNMADAIHNLDWTTMTKMF